MTKQEIRQQMKEINKLIQLAPISTPEEREAFHQLQDEYNQLAAKKYAM